MIEAGKIADLVETLRFRIGMTGPETVRRIEAGALVKFARTTGQDDPLYVDEAAAQRGPFGALIAPPTYLSTFCEEAMGDLIVSDLPFSMFLHTDDEVELLAPIRAGDDIKAVARYADVFVREGRHGPMLFQVAELRLSNQRNEPVATLRVGLASFQALGDK